MPNRILKESVCSSRSIENLSKDAEILFYRLLVVADDYGRFDASPEMVRAKAFPLRIDRIPNEAVSGFIGELSAAGIVEVYEINGVHYGQFSAWSKHQNIRAKRSKFPAPASDVKSSASICAHLQANVPGIQSNPIQSESNPNTTKEGEGGAVFSAPLLPQEKWEHRLRVIEQARKVKNGEIQ